MWSGDLDHNLREAYVVASRSGLVLAVGMAELGARMNQIAPVNNVGTGGRVAIELRQVEGQAWSNKPMTDSNILRYSVIAPRSERRFSLRAFGIQGQGDIIVKVWEGPQDTNFPPGQYDEFTLSQFGGCQAETLFHPEICPLFGGSNDRWLIYTDSTNKRFDRMDELLWLPYVVNRQRNAMRPNFNKAVFPLNPFKNEPRGRFELPTSGLRYRRSTAELPRHR